MSELTDEECLLVSGGFTFSGSLLNGIYRSINSLLDLGRSIGTSLRMLKEGRICPL